MTYLVVLDDIWIVCQGLDFEPSCTFLARSVFYGPIGANEVEIEPISGYSPSNWPNNGTHTSLSTISNNTKSN